MYMQCAALKYPAQSIMRRNHLFDAITDPTHGHHEIPLVVPAFYEISLGEYGFYQAGTPFIPPSPSSS